MIRSSSCCREINDIFKRRVERRNNSRCVLKLIEYFQILSIFTIMYSRIEKTNKKSFNVLIELLLIRTIVVDINELQSKNDFVEVFEKPRVAFTCSAH